MVTMASPLAAFIAIWASAVTVCSQEDGRGGPVRPVDDVQFLLTEGQPVHKVAPLPHGIILNCELIVGIQVTPFVPRKQDEDDYGDYPEENNIEPAREAGEVMITLNHPNFEDGQEEILVAVDKNGNGFKKETICFKHCANITDKGFTLSAKTDLKSTVDIKLVQEKGNHQCQKEKIVVKYNTTTIEKYKKEAETNKTIAIVFGTLFGICLCVLCIELVHRRIISARKGGNVEKYGGQGNIEMKSLNEESETPPPASRDNIKRGLPCRVLEEVKVVKGSGTMGDNKEQQNDWFKRIFNRYSLLIMATVVLFLLTFIYAILTVLASNKIK